MSQISELKAVIAECERHMKIDTQSASLRMNHRSLTKRLKRLESEEAEFDSPSNGAPMTNPEREKLCEHTELPWVQWYDHPDIYAGTVELNNRHSIQGDDSLVCVAICDDDELAVPEAIANAQFIVTACNSYYNNQHTIATLTAELAEVREQLAEAVGACEAALDDYVAGMPPGHPTGTQIMLRAVVAKPKIIWYPAQ